MTLSFVLFLFLAHLAIGIIFTLVLVSKVAGVQFFRFNAGYAAALLLVALAMRPDEVILNATVQGAALAALLVATGAILISWATIGRVLGTMSKIGIAMAMWIALSVSAFW